MTDKPTRSQLLNEMKIYGMITNLTSEQYLDLQACLQTHSTIIDYSYWWENWVKKVQK